MKNVMVSGANHEGAVRIFPLIPRSARDDNHHGLFSQLKYLLSQPFPREYG